MIISGQADPSFVVSHEISIDEAPQAYKKFDQRIEGYTKVLYVTLSFDVSLRIEQRLHCHAGSIQMELSRKGVERGQHRMPLSFLTSSSV